jgi:Mn2+/Fe2+ NRAMP family transporter
MSLPRSHQDAATKAAGSQYQGDAIAPADQSGPHKANKPGGKESRVRHILSILGPGLITGASDDDPSGIGTYSVAGAQFGDQTVSASLVTYPRSAAVQEVCARIGLVTGHGLAAIIKQYFPRWVLYVVAFLLVAANTLNIGADIEAMAASFHMVFPMVIKNL